MPDSIHTARWVNQISSGDLQIYLFSSTSNENLHQNLQNTNIRLRWSKFTIFSNFAKSLGLNFISQSLDSTRKYIEKRFPSYRPWRLYQTIKHLRPDIIHALEIQSAGYLTLEAKLLSSEKFPMWIVTNWGSDIYLFGKLSSHRNRIKAVLESCDYYSCECLRDVQLAREFGFNKLVLPLMPNGGGFDLTILDNLRNMTCTSKRKLVMLKGYQNWAGRALFGLRALENCADILTDYTIVIYSPSPEVEIAAQLFSQRTGIKTELLSGHAAHSEMLSLHGRARISLGLSISDGISTSLLEAMVMGSFPIQSCTACCHEWITDGITGLIVPPEDVGKIEKAIRIAISDDSLVDSASIYNWETALKRLNGSELSTKATAIYYQLISEGRSQ